MLFVSEELNLINKGDLSRPRMQSWNSISEQGERGGRWEGYPIGVVALRRELDGPPEMLEFNMR